MSNYTGDENNDMSDKLSKLFKLNEECRNLMPNYIESTNLAMFDELSKLLERKDEKTANQLQAVCLLEKFIVFVDEYIRAIDEKYARSFE